MDNASFQRTQRADRCLDAGVELLFLPPCSADFNLIEEFFSELKQFNNQINSHNVRNAPRGFNRVSQGKCIALSLTF
jgi:transposase